VATTKRRISGAIASYLAEAETWRDLHDEPMACLEFEELLTLGISAFDAIDRWDSIWHQKVNSGSVRFDPDYERQILDLYELWHFPSTFMLEEVARFEAAGYDVTGADQFRAYCGDVEGMLTPVEEFFGQELSAPEAEASLAHKNGETDAFEELGD
jgi:hypothetical protein